MSGTLQPDGSICHYTDEPHPKWTEADQAFRELHKMGDYHTFTGGPFCLACHRVWPCMPAFEHDRMYHQRADETVEEWKARFNAMSPPEWVIFSPDQYAVRHGYPTWDFYGNKIEHPKPQ